MFVENQAERPTLEPAPQVHRTQFMDGWLARNVDLGVGGWVHACDIDLKAERLHQYQYCTTVDSSAQRCRSERQRHDHDAEQQKEFTSHRHIPTSPAELGLE
ncbi:hypothetical protein SLA2020_299880 [Shorea laevis]